MILPSMVLPRTILPRTILLRTVLPGMEFINMILEVQYFQVQYTSKDSVTGLKSCEITQQKLVSP